MGHKKTKLNICHHMLTSSTQLQNWSFHVVERTRTSTKCEKNEICTCKACKNTIFHCQICKFVGFLLPSSSWLLKVAYDSFIRVQEVYTIDVQIFFCINILITNKNPYVRQLLLQIIVWEVKGARNGKTVHD